LDIASGKPSICGPAAQRLQPCYSQVEPTVDVAEVSQSASIGHFWPNPAKRKPDTARCSARWPCGVNSQVLQSSRLNSLIAVFPIRISRLFRRGGVHLHSPYPTKIATARHCSLSQCDQTRSGRWTLIWPLLNRRQPSGLIPHWSRRSSTVAACTTATGTMTVIADFTKAAPKPIYDLARLRQSRLRPD
jgi:hypothetical protein